MLPLNSKCLAFHGPLLYEAKVLKIHPQNKPHIIEKDNTLIPIQDSNLPPEFHDQLAYFIHYKGWKSSWDEWVDEKRVLAWSFENLRTQKELKAAALASSNNSVTVNSNSNKKRSSSGNEHEENGKKRKNNDSTIEKEEDFLKRPEISLVIPNKLKGLLVDDWEYVTKDNKLIKLPAKKTVAEIIKEYKKQCSKKDAVIDEVLSGLELYFNRSIGVLLLYRIERKQYLNIRKEIGGDMSNVYGAEHLLRLFVSLPGLIAQTSMDQQSIGILKDCLEDMLRYMENHQDMFSGEYESVSVGYERSV